MKCFCKELKELLHKYNVLLGVDLDGDTHNLQTSFVITNYKTDEEYILGNMCHIGPSDLENIK